MKRELVLDSSTAILLAKINLLSLVANEYKVIFPESVKGETTKKKDAFDSKLIAKLIGENKIKIVKVKKAKSSKLLEDFNIEEGEADSLVLAREKKHILATDDGPTIKVCKILNVKFTTAIHFLIYYYKKRMLSKEIALEKLKLLEKYGRYNYDIIKDAKNKIGE